MNTQIIIPLEGFPEEGLLCCGEVDSSILALQDGGMRSSGPICYELSAQLFERELLVTGKVSVPFRMRCDRCLEEFDYTVAVEPLTLSFEVQDAPALDITEAVREELILALPAYPKCELADKECQINDIIGDFRLDKAPSSGVDSATPSGKSVWDALDQFTDTTTQA